MSEIKHNEVEQNKAPEPSPRTASESDSSKLKPAEGSEGSIENNKGKDSGNKESSQGEHPKLSPESDNSSRDSGAKPEKTKTDNPHGMLSTGESDAEKEKQPVTDDPNAKKTGEASPDIKNPPEERDSASDKKRPPIENTANPIEEVNPRNLPVLSTRASLREDLPEGATKDGNIGDYPVKFANWDPAFANPEDAMENKTLEPGTYYRYGGPDGNFITKREPGQPLENLYDGLALPYEYDPSKWSVVDVKEPLQNVHCGEVGKQSNFGENGGG